MAVKAVSQGTRNRVLRAMMNRDWHGVGVLAAQLHLSDGYVRLALRALYADNLVERKAHTKQVGTGDPFAVTNATSVSWRLR